jgi:aspartate aminotransferase
VLEPVADLLCVIQRVGFAGGPRPLIAAMTNMQGQIGSGISTISQAAATAALDGPQD